MPPSTAGEPDELQLRLALEIANKEEIRRDAQEVQALADQAMATVLVARAQAGALAWSSMTDVAPAYADNPQAWYSVGGGGARGRFTGGTGAIRVAPSLTPPPGVPSQRIDPYSYSFMTPPSSSTFRRGVGRLGGIGRRMSRFMIQGYVAEELLGDQPELAPNEDLNAMQMLGELGGSAAAYGVTMGPGGIYYGLIMGALHIARQEVHQFERRIEEKAKEEEKRREALEKSLEKLEKVAADLASKFESEVEKLEEETYLGFRDTRGR